MQFWSKVSHARSPPAVNQKKFLFRVFGESKLTHDSAEAPPTPSCPIINSGTGAAAAPRCLPRWFRSRHRKIYVS
ncbi:unnamed protein product [Caretta caretta]